MPEHLLLRFGLIQSSQKASHLCCGGEETDEAEAMVTGAAPRWWSALDMLDPVLGVRNTQVNKLQLEALEHYSLVEGKTRIEKMTGLYVSLKTEKWLGAGEPVEGHLAAL